MSKRKGMSSKGRGSGFLSSEVGALLDELEDSLPLCTVEWEAVLRLHIFQLVSPTSANRDPMIPPDVKRAKLIRIEMPKRADIGTATEEGNLLSSNESASENDAESDYEAQDGTQAQMDSTAGAYNDLERIGHRESLSTSSVLTPRPLVSKRQKTSEVATSSSTLRVLEMQLILEDKRREADREWREEERRVREAERKEKQEELRRREEERREDRKELYSLLAFMFGIRKNSSD
ncbi:hypothetical protein Ae201684P_005110 [Aphanomyces euteiches]|nr:hypothetical protein Ae201684P_005110 [Aphanomyces euteiches]